MIIHELFGLSFLYEKVTDKFLKSLRNLNLINIPGEAAIQLPESILALDSRLRGNG
jgi:hypothetical protein